MTTWSGFVVGWLGVTLALGCAGSIVPPGADGEAGVRDAADGREADSALADAATDAGDPMTDARSDAPADVPSPPLCGPGGAAIFCEGFERPLGPEWTIVNGTPANGCSSQDSSGMGQLDTTRSASGSGSWHAHVDYGADLGSCQAEMRRAVPLPSPDTFLRMFVYLPAASATIPFELNMLTDGHGYAAVGLAFAPGPLHVESYGGVTATGRSAVAFPTDRWVCVEWQLHRGTSATVSAWQEGATVIDQAPATIDAGSHLDSLFFGVYGVSSHGVADLWFDDVAVSAARIGCTGR